ncbi:hypothetical protein VPG91_13010 [Nitrospirillum amazonense]|uniref:hypothetical protein n=1 Tax=Nitrospirillum amazonense TaxID=28077 RepID=UPI002DD422FD|nr:hypothetical protein [Nitrospirillum amazonense]MEC4591910.1 hypothetical protein [Nitrospirillum amazonense]
MPKYEDVPVSRIFLFLKNPRHEEMKTEAEVIEHLCKAEDVYPLARDIAKYGLNPLERFALYPVSRKGSQGQGYIVPEGNRRMCALKLLNDPELAPPNLRKSFEKLSEEWAQITIVPSVIFEDYDSVKHWLERIHGGAQGGVGRKAWNSEQKTRFDGDSKNKPTQELLDYAVASGMITTEERKNKLTTAQRFLSNVVFRETIGFDYSNPDAVGRTRPQKDFDILVKRFMRDLVEGKSVNSRMNKEQIIDYARIIGAIPSISNNRIQTESLSIDKQPPGSARKPTKRPQVPARVRYIAHEDNIARALNSFGNEKLKSLYYSICSIELEYHTPIVCVGVWAFFETLTVCAGRDANISFDSFLSKGKLSSFGFKETRPLQEAITRILAYGNTTKHHRASATFNGDQLNNDMTVLKDVIVKCIEEAIQKGT